MMSILLLISRIMRMYRLKCRVRGCGRLLAKFLNQFFMVLVNLRNHKEPIAY